MADYKEANYDFELDKIISEIKNTKAKTVGLQFPEGLKIYAVQIAEEIEKRTNAKTIIFTNLTYGACDLPKEEDLNKLEIDILVHFGHEKFNY